MHLYRTCYKFISWNLKRTGLKMQKILKYFLLTYFSGDISLFLVVPSCQQFVTETAWWLWGGGEGEEEGVTLWDPQLVICPSDKFDTQESQIPGCTVYNVHMFMCVQPGTNPGKGGKYENRAVHDSNTGLSPEKYRRSKSNSQLVTNWRLQRHRRATSSAIRPEKNGNFLNKETRIQPALKKVVLKSELFQHT
jgi:hypothetical protein